MQLRDYQKKLVSGIASAFSQGAKSPVAVAPTGSGKTAVMAHIAKGAASKGNSCGILAHRQELITQTSLALARAGVWHSVIAPDSVIRECFKIHVEELGRSFYNADAPSHVASVQTLTRRLKTGAAPDPFRLLFIDECHHAVAGQWAQVIEAMPDAKILGVTATPERLDGRGLGITSGGPFDHMVQGPTVDELISLGFLSRPKIYSPPSEIDVSKFRTEKGDYKRQDADAAVDKASITGDVIDHYRRLANGIPSIAFCVSVNHAQHVAEQFTAAGFRAACVDGTMSDAERRRAIRALGEGRLHVLTSCDIVSEGTDIPIVGAAILLRPTKSLGLYLQQVGRVLRPYQGKEYSIILDHVGNALQHGLPEESRDWSLDGRKKKTRGERDAAGPSVTTCFECYATFSPTLDACPMCGAAVEKSQRKLEQREGDLVEVDEAALQAHRRREQGMAQTYDDLVAMGRRKGYKSPESWARHIIATRQRKKAPIVRAPGVE